MTLRGYMGPMPNRAESRLKIFKPHGDIVPPIASDTLNIARGATALPRECLVLRYIDGMGNELPILPGWIGEKTITPIALPIIDDCGAHEAMNEHDEE